MDGPLASSTANTGTVDNKPLFSLVSQQPSLLRTGGAGDTDNTGLLSVIIDCNQYLFTVFHCIIPTHISRALRDCYYGVHVSSLNAKKKMCNLVNGARL